MHFLDYIIFALYMAGVLGIGFYHFRRNKNAEDYYVGSRKIKASHVGLSIVATDVGGGFSIGLGGLGYMMGLSASWLLFTGLLGAWLSAVLIIPRIKKIDRQQGMFTYPDFLRFRYNGSVALLAAIISGIGYLGFTGGQIRAGATLSAKTIFSELPWDIDPVTFSLFAIAFITIIYTVVGGLKAVIYTDTAQWLILLIGLIFVTIPVAYFKIGGWAAMRAELPEEFFSLAAVHGGWIQFFNWMITLTPIWLIGMTLYQRMFACRDEREAKIAWYVAGFFEYPIMAFMGVILGMFSRVMFPEVEPESGLPMLISEVLPPVVTGVVIASYFSAIMSTADSCMMASSGNFVNDVIERYVLKKPNESTVMRVSQVVTLIIGLSALLLASYFQTVLDAIILAYSFMVSGLFIPTLGAYFWPRGSSTGAFFGMLLGGSFTLIAIILGETMGTEPWLGLDFTFYGICVSAAVYVVLSLLFPDEETADIFDESAIAAAAATD